MELLDFFGSFFSFSFFSFLSFFFFLGLESESLPEALPPFATLEALAALPPDASDASESVVATFESYSSATSLSSPGLKSSSFSSESPLESPETTNVYK